MQVLLANLRHFYQHRGLWLIYACFAGLIALNASYLAVLGETDREARENLLIVLSFAAAVFGLIVGWHQTSVVLRPFALCLPGHPTAARRVIFLMGFLAALVASVLSIQCIEQPDVPLTQLGLVLGSAFCVHLIAYLIAAGTAFSFSIRAERGFSPASGLLLLVSLLLFVFAGAALLMHLRRTLPADLERAIVHSPFLIIALGVTIVTTAWLWLGRLMHSRHLVTRRETVFRCQTPATSGRGNFFLSRMCNSEYTSAGKHIWAMLYAWLLPGGGGRMTLILCIACSTALSVLAWYMPFIGSVFIVMASLWAPVDMGSASIFSKLLMAGGRRERFCTTMVYLIIFGSIVTLTIAFTFTIIDLLGPHLPWTAIRAEELEYPSRLQPINLELALLLTTILFPVGRFFETMFWPRWVLAVVGETPLVLLAAEITLWKGAWILELDPAWLAGGIILSWLVLTFGIYRITMRSDLVRR